MGERPGRVTARAPCAITTRSPSTRRTGIGFTRPAEREAAQETLDLPTAKDVAETVAEKLTETCGDDVNVEVRTTSRAQAKRGPEVDDGPGYSPETIATAERIDEAVDAIVDDAISKPSKRSKKTARKGAKS